MLDVALKAVGFDLDGTLIDSKASIVHGFQEALKHFGYEAPAVSTVRSMIGRPMHDFLHLVGYPVSNYDDFMSIYNTFTNIWINIFAHLKAPMKH